MPKKTVDLHTFKAEVKAAAARAFTAIKGNHPDETFYAFALYSDDGAMTVNPAANSEQALERSVAAYGKRGKAMLGELRWSPAEWEYEDEAGDELDDAYDQLNTLLEKVGDDEFERFREAAYTAMVDALDELNTEGFFGRGKERAAVTVFFTISDSEDSERWERRSVKRLNPASVQREFVRDPTRWGGSGT